MSLSINCLTISGHSNSRPQTLSWEWAQCPVGAAPEPSSITHTPPPSLRWLHSWSLTFFIWFSLSYFDSRLFGLGILRAWEGLLIIFFWIMPHMLKVTEQWCLKKKISFARRREKRHLILTFQARDRWEHETGWTSETMVDYLLLIIMKYSSSDSSCCFKNVR